MRCVILWAALGLLGGAGPSFAAEHRAHHGTEPAADVLFKVAGLQFMVPAKWVSVPTTNPVRVQQWRIPALDPAGVPGELVVFYFGPGLGGSVQGNIREWLGTVVEADGRASSAATQTRMAGGLKISQVVAYGTYNATVPIAGFPPVARPDYGLIGTVMETSEGNLYWRFTGPRPLLTADLPVLNKVMDGVKPEGK
jgi:hypothetical protein